MEIKTEKRVRKYSPRTSAHKRNAKARVYIFVSGETILENLANRRSRPVAFYRKEVLPNVIEDAHLQGHKLSWSQKAGCSCGCSPGFVVDDAYGFDVFVTVSENASHEAA